MKRFLNHTLLPLLIAFLITMPMGLQAQTNLRGPTIRTTGLLNLTWTAGTINNGGHAVAITASSTNATASKTDCAAPTYTSCNILVAGSTGTVSVVTTIALATASGVTILAYAETDGTVITKLSFPQQNSQAYTSIGAIPRTAFFSCGTSAACTPVNQSTVLNMQVVYGSAALVSASPSTASISAISPAFTSTSTYWCAASAQGTTAAIAAAGFAINKTSGSAFTITGPNTVTTVVDWVCFGT